MPDLILSHIRLNLRHPAVRLERRDVCRMHARVVDATVAMPDGPRVLWAQPEPGLVVVRATEPVTWQRLPADYTEQITHRPWTPPGPGRHRAVMVVNPVKQTTVIRPDGTRQNVRKPVDGWDAQLAWLREHLEPMISRLEIGAVADLPGVGWHRDGHRVVHKLLAVQLRGEVTDPVTLAGIVIRGFGRARAYGGGLSIWQKA